MTETTPSDRGRSITPEALAQLGGGHVAYMRPVDADEVPRLFPQAPRIARGTKLWVLLAADGTPIVLADSPNAVLANAARHDLTMVSVH